LGICLHYLFFSVEKGQFVILGVAVINNGLGINLQFFAFVAGMVGSNFLATLFLFHFRITNNAEKTVPGP
jgi:hypothetical protein